MARRNTVVFSVINEAPRLKAVEVFDFVQNELGLKQENIGCLQIDVSINRFYLKLVEPLLCDELVLRAGGKYVLSRSDGSLCSLSAEHASGLGSRLIRVFNLPPELEGKVVAEAFSVYGKVLNVRLENWTSGFLKGVPNGIRHVLVELSKHVPSFVAVGKLGKFMTTYDGQPRTCAKCDLPGHTRHDCITKALNKRRWERIPENLPLKEKVPETPEQAGTETTSPQAPVAQGAVTSDPVVENVVLAPSKSVSAGQSFSGPQGKDQGKTVKSAKGAGGKPSKSSVIKPAVLTQEVPANSKQGSKDDCSGESSVSQDKLIQTASIFSEFPERPKNRRRAASNSPQRDSKVRSVELKDSHTDDEMDDSVVQ